MEQDDSKVMPRSPGGMEDVWHGMEDNLSQWSRQQSAGRGQTGPAGSHDQEGGVLQSGSSCGGARTPHLPEVDDLPMDLLRRYPTSDQGRGMTGLLRGPPGIKMPGGARKCRHILPWMGESNVEET